jgi:hypothetical protein
VSSCAVAPGGRVQGAAKVAEKNNFKNSDFLRLDMFKHRHIKEN